MARYRTAAKFLVTLSILADGHWHDSLILEKQLGVCRRTVIRMIHAIEAMGFTVEYGTAKASSRRVYRFVYPAQAQRVLRWKTS